MLARNSGSRGQQEALRRGCKGPTATVAFAFARSSAGPLLVKL